MCCATQHCCTNKGQGHNTDTVLVDLFGCPPDDLSCSTVNGVHCLLQSVCQQQNITSCSLTLLCLEARFPRPTSCARVTLLSAASSPSLSCTKQVSSMFTHSFIPACTNPVITSFTCYLFLPSFIHSLLPSSIHPSAHSPTHPPTHSFNSHFLSFGLITGVKKTLTERILRMLGLKDTSHSMLL